MTDRADVPEKSLEEAAVFLENFPVDIELEAIYGDFEIRWDRPVMLCFEAELSISPASSHSCWRRTC